jgi:hypothetical protein
MPDRGRVVDEKVLTPQRTRASAAQASGTQQYRILRTSETDPYDVPLQPDEVATLGVERFAGFDDTYRGTARKAAKLSIADAQVEDLEDIKDLIETLPAIEVMTSHEPPITTDATSGRVDEENRNVRVRAFLYAASREDDNDYHLIVGRAPDLEPMYLTMELSGLPSQDSDHFPRLEAAPRHTKGSSVMICPALRTISTIRRYQSRLKDRCSSIRAIAPARGQDQPACAPICPRSGRSIP